MALFIVLHFHSSYEKSLSEPHSRFGAQITWNWCELNCPQHYLELELIAPKTGELPFGAQITWN